MKKTIRAVVAGCGIVFFLCGSVFSQAATTDEVDGDAWDALAKAGRQSSDLRVRIAYSLTTFVGKDDAIHFGEAIPIETLVDQARGSTDPIVLSLMVDRCASDLQKVGRCDAVDFARRWTVADTQNQLAWIALSTVLDRQGNTENAGSAFRRAALASQWHEYSPELARLLAQLAPNASDPRLRVAALLAAVTKAWTALPNGHYQTVSKHCKEAESRDACGRILEVMARDAQSLMTLNLATMLASRALPSMTVSVMRQHTDAIWWGATQRPVFDADVTATPEGAARAVADIEAQIATNEIEAARGFLQKAGVSESTAAQWYVATLSPAQIAYRGNGVSKAQTAASP